MRLASPGLISLLNSGAEFIMADLYTFTLAINSETLRYSAGPTPLFAPSYVATLLCDGGSGLTLPFGNTAAVEVGDLAYNLGQNFPQEAVVTGIAPNISISFSAVTGTVSAGNVAFARPTLFGLGPKFERTMTRTVIGVQVDQLEVKVYPENTDTVAPTTFLKGLWTGLFDGAELMVERAFMAPYGSAVGTVVLFSGRISDINTSRTEATIKCRSHLELLNIQMPRRLLQPTCTHIFGGPMCGYDRLLGRNALGTSTGVGALTFAAGAGSTALLIMGAPSSSNPYKLGTIVGLTGENTAYSRTIYGFSSGVSVAVKLAFPFPVVPGDQFQILPGCDRALATCVNVFQNQVLGGEGRFGGAAYIPTPETAV